MAEMAAVLNDNLLPPNECQRKFSDSFKKDALSHQWHKHRNATQQHFGILLSTDKGKRRFRFIPNRHFYCYDMSRIPVDNIPMKMYTLISKNVFD